MKKILCPSVHILIALYALKLMRKKIRKCLLRCLMGAKWSKVLDGHSHCSLNKHTHFFSFAWCNSGYQLFWKAEYNRLFWTSGHLTQSPPSFCAIISWRVQSDEDLDTNEPLASYPTQLTANRQYITLHLADAFISGSIQQRKCSTSLCPRFM